jgi:hypothetical protein
MEDLMSGGGAGLLEGDDFMSGAKRAVPKVAAESRQASLVDGNRAGSLQRVGESGGFMVRLVAWCLGHVHACMHAYMHAVLAVLVETVVWDGAGA